jgi:hypothetical protein
MNLPNMKAPCLNCPFKKDTLKGWLGKYRAIEIATFDSFVCHKNNDKQCAGHTIMEDDNNSFVRLVGRLGMDTKLSGQDTVFKRRGDFIAHHSKTGMRYLLTLP